MEGNGVSQVLYISNLQQIRRKERNEAHLYMNVNVVLEEAFDGHQGNDLYDPERAHYRVFRVRKQATVAELMEMLAENFKYPLKQLRPWPFSARSNQVRGLTSCAYSFPNYIEVDFLSNHIQLSTSS